MPIVKAKLIRMNTDDGAFEMLDEVKLGKMYNVILESRQEIEVYNIFQRKFHKREMIRTEQGEWLPTEMLEIDTRVLH